MSEPSPAPDPDLIYGLYADGFKGQIVRLALLVDVFTPLALGPADARTVAHACRCDESVIRVLLDYLSSLQLLHRRGDTYALTRTAATFLVRGQRTYAGGWVLAETDSKMWDAMLQTLRSGQHSYGIDFPWSQDAWLESFRLSRPTESLEMWRAAGIEPGKRTALRVLDLACGCAIKSLVLAQADPTAHITCIDSAEVLEVTRDLADRLHVLPQVTFMPGQLPELNLGEGCYDATLLSQITYSLTPSQNTEIFRRVYKALSPHGILLIDAIMTSNEPSESAALVSLLMHTISGGTTYSFAEYRKCLEEVGFRQVTQISEKWLSAAKR